MRNKYKFLLLILFFLTVGLLIVVYLQGSNIAVLNPQGIVSSKERDLIMLATALMLVVVIPVFLMTFIIAWKYRASNTSAKYTPDWDHNSVAEFTWWAIPTAIIIVLALVTWKSSHELDPFKPLVSDKKPITIQVVALQWKWLFIYPEQGIATVNLVEFPENTPINFEITSDAPMNSFWIPSLGGQVYAMSGMKTMLHLMADKQGSFNGSSANLSGRGFAGMRFIAKSSTNQDFDSWVQSVKQSPNVLSVDEYNKLIQPSEDNKASYYSWEDGNLYDNVVMKYVMPMPQLQSSGHNSLNY